MTEQAGTDAATDPATDPARTPVGDPGARRAERKPAAHSRHQRAGGRLHQPWRVVVAAVELVVAAVAVWVAFPVWNAGIREVTVEAADGTALTSQVYDGNWISFAVALGALALVLVIDAIRQLMLGIAAKGKKPKKRKEPEPDYPDTDPDSVTP